MKLRKGGKFNNKTISENCKSYQKNKENFSNIDNFPECEEYKISEKMEKNLKLLAEVDDLILNDRERKNKIKKRRINIALGFVASFIVIIAISVFSMRNQSYAGLIDIINYWIKPSQKETEITVEKETNNVIVDDFVEPTYIPDEYKDIQREEGKRYIRITYKNNLENKTIRYKCNFVSNSSEVGLDTEDAEVEHINLDNKDIMLIYKNDMINVFFIDDIYKVNILFELSDNMNFEIGKQEVIKIVKSIK